jgi:hypothetical protein
MLYNYFTLKLNIKLSMGTAIFDCLISIGDKVKHVESVLLNCYYGMSLTLFQKVKLTCKCVHDVRYKYAKIF